MVFSLPVYRTCKAAHGDPAARRALGESASGCGITAAKGLKHHAPVGRDATGSEINDVQAEIHLAMSHLQGNLILHFIQGIDGVGRCSFIHFRGKQGQFDVGHIFEVSCV